MVAAVVAVAFVGMVLAPCAVAIYSKLGSGSESREEVEASAPAPVEETVEMPAPTPPTELGAPGEGYVSRPVPLATRALPLEVRPMPVRVPSLFEVAEMAAREAMRAHAVAAQARVEALQEASREAARRAQASQKLAEAAERELVRATQASLQAEEGKERAKMAQQSGSERDYLPEDHPSLDFPRSRITPRKVA